jgi:hypothetical protein
VSGQLVYLVLEERREHSSFRHYQADLEVAAGLILSVESNQNVESKIKVVKPKDPFCGVHIDALVGCLATLVL